MYVVGPSNCHVDDLRRDSVCHVRKLSSSIVRGDGTVSQAPRGFSSICGDHGPHSSSATTVDAGRSLMWTASADFFFFSSRSFSMFFVRAPVVIVRLQIYDKRLVSEYAVYDLPTQAFAATRRLQWWTFNRISICYKLSIHVFFSAPGTHD